MLRKKQKKMSPQSTFSMPGHTRRREYEWLHDFAERAKTLYHCSLQVARCSDIISGIQLVVSCMQFYNRAIVYQFFLFYFHPFALVLTTIKTLGKYIINTALGLKDWPLMVYFVFRLTGFKEKKGAFSENHRVCGNMLT